MVASQQAKVVFMNEAPISYFFRKPTRPVWHLSFDQTEIQQSKLCALIQDRYRNQPIEQNQVRTSFSTSYLVNLI